MLNKFLKIVHSAALKIADASTDIRRNQQGDQRVGLHVTGCMDRRITIRRECDYEYNIPSPFAPPGGIIDEMDSSVAERMAVAMNLFNVRHELALAHTDCGAMKKLWRLLTQTTVLSDDYSYYRRYCIESLAKAAKTAHELMKDAKPEERHLIE